MCVDKQKEDDFTAISSWGLVYLLICDLKSWVTVFSEEVAGNVRGRERL